MKVKKICENDGCDNTFETEQANINRGWGRFCSKSCATSARLRTRHAANRKLREQHKVKTTEDEIELIGG